MAVAYFSMAEPIYRLRSAPPPGEKICGPGAPAHQRIIEAFRCLQNRVDALEAEQLILVAENDVLRAKLGSNKTSEVFAELAMLVTHTQASNLQRSTISESCRDDGAATSSSSGADRSDTKSQKWSHGPRNTIVSYETLGASAADSAEQVKKKYRVELLQRHIDKGGDHAQFLRLQASIDYIANKRGSVAEQLGKAKNSSGRPNSTAHGEHAELEGDLATEAGHAALDAGQPALSIEAGHPWSETVV